MAADVAGPWMKVLQGINESACGWHAMLAPSTLPACADVFVHAARTQRDRQLLTSSWMAAYVAGLWMKVQRAWPAPL